MKNIKINEDTYIKRRGENVLAFSVETDGLYVVRGNAGALLELLSALSAKKQQLTLEKISLEFAKESESFRDSDHKIEVLTEALTYFSELRLVCYDT